jgi:hypothetical protein
VERGALGAQVSEQADFGAMVDDFIEYMHGQAHRVRLNEGSPRWSERRGPLAGAEPGEPGAPVPVVLVEEAGDRAARAAKPIRAAVSVPSPNPPVREAATRFCLCHSRSP